MEAPRLIGASPRALLAAEQVALGRASYALTYALSAPPGACALQRVETRVRFLRGEEVLVEYHAMYWEFFRFAADPGDPPEARLDLHDFHISRDGWGPDRVGRLLRRHRVAAAGGPTRLHLEKRFLLGLATVDGGGVTLTTPRGGAFGLLEEAEGERRWLRLRVGGQDVEDAAQPLPGPARGAAAFTLDARLAAEERLEFGFATLSGLFTSTGYSLESGTPQAPLRSRMPQTPRPLL